MENEIVIKKVLIAVDGSPESVKAARLAIKIAKNEGAAVIAFHVLTKHVYVAGYPTETALLSDSEDYRKQAESYLANVWYLGRKAGIDVRKEVIERYVGFSISAVIVQFANLEGCDLIVMGTRGKSSLRKKLLGSAANGVVSNAHCPVLVVR